MNVKLLFLSLISCGTMFSQVGIGNTNPKATLEVTGKPTDNTVVDGIILPKLTGNELKAKDLIYTADQLGAMVYVTAAASPTTAKTANVTTAGYYYYDGSVWLKSNSNLQVGYKTIAAAYPTTPSKGDIVFTTSDGTVAGTKYRIETYDGTSWVNDKGVYAYIVTIAYAAGDIVSKDGLLYESNAAIPANTAFAIGTTGATWKAIGLGNTSETGSASVSQNPLGGTAGSPTVLATFTLPSAGTYELKYNLRVANTAMGTVAFTWFRNSAGIMITDSYKETWNGNNNSMVTTASSSVFVTVTAAESYTLVGYGTSMEIRLGSNLTWNKIAGYLPTLGQSVDYAYSSRTAAQTTGISVGLPIVFTSSSGNISQSSGIFTLISGKTYSLQGAPGGSNGDRGLAVRWRDITNNVLIGSEGSCISPATNNANAVSGGIASAIITPSSNITVRLEIVGFLNGTAPTQIGFFSDQPNSSPWAQIIQIGTSGITNNAPLTITESTTITATTTAPTKANTRTQDYITLTDNNSGWCEVEMVYAHDTNTGTVSGSGTYLFSLPAGYSFNTTTHPLNTQINILSGSAEIYKGIAASGIVMITGFESLSNYVVPHSTTQFKIMAMSPTLWGFINNGYYAITAPILTYKVRFRFKKA